MEFQYQLNREAALLTFVSQHTEGPMPVRLHVLRSSWTDCGQFWVFICQMLTGHSMYILSVILCLSDDPIWVCLILVYVRYLSYVLQKALAGLRRINLEGLRWRVFDAKGQVWVSLLFLSCGLVPFLEISSWLSSVLKFLWNSNDGNCGCLDAQISLLPS